MGFPWNNADAPNFPAYLQHAHQDWLDGSEYDGGTYEYNVKAYLEAALTSGSPYALAEVFDPNELLDEADSLYTTFGLTLDDLTSADVSGYYTTAAALAPSVLDAGAKIDAMVTAFADKEKDRLYADLNMQAGAAFETRSNRMSQFQMGLATTWRGYHRNVAAYRAEQEMQQTRLESAFILQAAQDYFKLEIMKIESKRMIASALADMKVRRIVANREQLAEELAIAEADATWELGLFEYGTNMLRGLSGVGQIPPRLGRGQGAGLAGMMGGAGLALSSGMAVGGALGVPAGIATTIVMLLLSGALGYAGGSH